MVKARKYILAKHFQGAPKKGNVQIVEENLPPVENGEFLCKAEFLSVDPYMRAYMNSFPEGSPMIGTQVARIIESKNKEFPVGKLVVGNYGWRDYTLDGGKHTRKEFQIVPTHILPDFGNLSPSLGVGTLGMPGNTAYFGLLEICKPKKNDVVVVTGAAGAVGSIVGQIAKIKGCTVIGFAGSDAKCEWLKSNGFDFAFNYKTVDAAEVLKSAAPSGVNCFFDNVGGKLGATVMSQMALYGRVAICGVISKYNEDNMFPEGVEIQRWILNNELRVEGFKVNRWANRWMEGIENLKSWIEKGEIFFEETVTQGFENMYDAFAEMLRGDAMGKAVVKA